MPKGRLIAPCVIDFSESLWTRLDRDVMAWVGEQKSAEWHSLRAGRLGSSSVGAALGRSNFETRLSVARRMLGFDPAKEMNAAMRAGVDAEDDIRLWYEKFAGCTVREIGIAVRVRPFRRLDAVSGEMLENGESFTEKYLAVSPDGLVGEDGIIEIKNAANGYRPLRHAHENLDLSSAHARGDLDSLREYIWKSHYDQMQLIMATLRRKWCDYVVREAPTQKTFVTRVPLDTEHWNLVMFPGLCDFFAGIEKAQSAASDAARSVAR